MLNRFSIDLISDYLAFDPTILSEQDRTDECELPIVETQPLQILIETTGSWDINANSPETSTSSHGSSAKRFGFRANENFVCRVVIKTEYYVVSFFHTQFTFYVTFILHDIINACSTSSTQYRSCVLGSGYQILPKLVFNVTCKSFFDFVCNAVLMFILRLELAHIVQRVNIIDKDIETTELPTYSEVLVFIISCMCLHFYSAYYCVIVVCWVLARKWY